MSARWPRIQNRAQLERFYRRTDGFVRFIYIEPGDLEKPIPQLVDECSAILATMLTQKAPD